MMDDKQIALAITGASGAPYAKRLLEVLLEGGHTVHLMISAAGRMVLDDELDWSLPNRAKDISAQLAKEFNCKPEQIRAYGRQEWASPLASGSHRVPTMIICPCTMATLSSVASGQSDDLINRAADVMMKEQRRLILVPREAPFSAIHLENMLKLARLGVVILPPNPGFYNRPESIDDIVDFVVARILDQARIEHNLMPRWGE